MSLILRTNISRPLTHEELDSNFKFVYVKRWEYDDYQQGQLVYVKSNLYSTLYTCLQAHVRYVYDPNKTFRETIQSNGQTTRLWEPIANTGNGSGAIGVYDPLLPDSMVVPKDLGGIEKGTTVGELRGDDFTTMFNLLLFPSISPEYVLPYITVTSSVSGLKIIGTAVNLTISVVANQGQILQPWSGNSLQNNRAGVVLWYSQALDGVYIPGGNQTTNASVTQSSILVTQGRHTITGQARFDQGPQPIDNYGEAIGEPYTATTHVIDLLFEGVYPVFATTIDLAVLTQQPLVSMITGNNVEFLLVAEPNLNNRQAFALPTTWLTSRPLLGVYYYNTVTGSYAEYNKINDFVVTNVTQTVIGSSVPYKKYTYNGLRRGDMRIKLVF